MDALLNYHGYLCGDQLLWSIPAALLILLFVGFFGSPLFVWAIAILALLFGFGAPLGLLIAVAVIFAFFLIVPLRAAVISRAVAALFEKMKFLPKISETERAAIDAGVVWVEKELFSGKPNFGSLMDEPYPHLKPEEKAFMDGPVAELCRMVKPWQVWKNREISKEAWDFIKEKGFLGMIIPREYGGLGFSALAHSEIIATLSARSLPVSISVMVPNSLGPAELLVHYGTEEQKKYYLPRLARGEDVPCFGLTEPLAGSDAGSITSTGVLYKGADGKLMIRLNWNKRWITLASISTVIGLAFRLRDPEGLLGQGEDLGITCALIPSNTPGVVIGRRHDPLTIPFHNCPTQGKDVEVSIDAVVGGKDGCGKGWRMLMECLAAGRGISLPAQATGGAKLAYRTVSAHGLVRRQFGVSIGKFEGVEEPMARIGGATYALEAMRRYTLGALDKGLKPAVITAMQKYYSTELGRRVVNDAMDIMGGGGISLGPRNLLAEIYVATPIGITVEGANIMTRTLIVFGQGALRAHPYAFDEVMSLEAKDIKAFDRAFWGHVGHIVRNTCRSILLSLTRGYLAATPSCHPQMRRYFRRLSWTSATFAILADVAMGTLGGQLKLREKITGRFADILMNMYVATAILRRFEAEKQPEEDLPYVHYMLKYCMSEIQKSFDGIFDNLKIPGLRWFFKGWLGAWSRINSVGSQASDGWSHAISKSMLVDGPQRDRMTEGLYLPPESSWQTEQTARLDRAFRMVAQADAAEAKIRKAVKEKILPKKKASMLIDEARAKNVITEDEQRLLREADQVRFDAILVDDFSEDQYHGRAPYP
ncbi:MAG: acyl-CoA dehydrogenase [Bdellovibrionaceae bacterium]|nr:acyl-CoA dehydrogenase [Pseudobdellovibrionaceae bacterium]